MVNLGRGFFAFLLIGLSLTWSATAKELTEYRLGDRVEQDIVTPEALKILDVEATAALKEKEGMRVLVILRYDPTVAADVEANVRDAFSNTRSNFIRAVERYYQRRQLETTDVATPQFETVRASFQRANKSFPVSTNLAASWALGDSGRVEQTEALDRVRAAMNQPIRDPGAPARIRVTTRARLVSVHDRDEELTLENIGNRGRTIQRTNAIALDRARRDLIAEFPADQAAVAKFVATFLQTNCRMEEDLTEKLRARETETLAVLAEYSAGDIVARTGQMVDAKILAAIQAIVEKRAEQALKESAALAAIRSAEAREQIKWLSIGGGVITFALAIVTWQWWRRRREAALLPVLAGAEGLTVHSPEAAAWQQRALEAERRAERAQEAIRAGVMTQVSTVLKEELVHGLITQRKEMIEAQRAAATEMEALEKRLTEIHAPLQERLNAYEARIAELEKALAAKDEQTRELIKAKIALVRQQLELERAKGDVLMN